MIPVVYTVHSRDLYYNERVKSFYNLEWVFLVKPPFHVFLVQWQSACLQLKYWHLPGMMQRFSQGNLLNVGRLVNRIFPITIQMASDKKKYIKKSLIPMQYKENGLQSAFQSFKEHYYNICAVSAL